MLIGFLSSTCVVANEDSPDLQFFRLSQSQQVVLEQALHDTRAFEVQLGHESHCSAIIERPLQAVDRRGCFGIFQRSSKRAQAVRWLCAPAILQNVVLKTRYWGFRSGKFAGTTL